MSKILTYLASFPLGIVALFIIQEKLKHVPADFSVCTVLAGKMIIDDYFVSIQQLLITVPVVANTVLMS